MTTRGHLTGLLFFIGVIHQLFDIGFTLGVEKLYENYAPQFWQSMPSLPAPDPWALIFLCLAALVYFWPKIIGWLEPNPVSVAYTCDGDACFIDPTSQSCSFNVWKHQYDDNGACIEQTVGIYFKSPRNTKWLKVTFEGGGHPQHDIPYIDENGAMVHIHGCVDGKRIKIEEQPSEQSS